VIAYCWLQPQCSGPWLLALPISVCCLRLSDEARRDAVSLRLVTTVYQTFNIYFGSFVDQLTYMHSLVNKTQEGFNVTTF
jgi:hypothetical protein